MSSDLRWRTSTHSSDQGGQCVAVAALDRAGEGCARGVAVRDSRDPGGPVLDFAPAAWGAFSARIKSGALDLHRR